MYNIIVEKSLPLTELYACNFDVLYIYIFSKAYQICIFISLCTFKSNYLIESDTMNSKPPSQQIA